MTRIEIIANNTVEEDIRDALEHVEEGFFHSRLNAVHGRGWSDPKSGDAVWPEENFIYIIYTEDDKAIAFAEAIRKLKEKFTQEGIRIFILPFNSPIEL